MTMRQQTNERLMRINDRGEIEAGEFGNHGKLESVSNAQCLRRGLWVNRVGGQS